MKTGHVPVLCMLLAGGVALVLDIIQGMNISTIVRDFLVSLIIFFIIGTVAKIILDKVFNPKEPEPEETEMEDFPVDGEGAEGGPESSEEGAFEGGEEQAAEQEETEDF